MGVVIAAKFCAGKEAFSYLNISENNVTPTGFRVVQLSTFYNNVTPTGFRLVKLPSSYNNNVTPSGFFAVNCLL